MQPFPTATTALNTAIAPTTTQMPWELESIWPRVRAVSKAEGTIFAPGRRTAVTKKYVGCQLDAFQMTLVKFKQGAWFLLTILCLLKTTLFALKIKL
jgi:hypothetical protein